jgi:hypothetical protein
MPTPCRSQMRGRPVRTTVPDERSTRVYEWLAAVRHHISTKIRNLDFHSTQLDDILLKDMVILEYLKKVVVMMKKLKHGGL